MTEDDIPTVVLVGAGHANLHIARKASAYTAAGARLILIDPGWFWYSGMATGLLSGRYSPEDDRIDPEALIYGQGGSFIRDSVVGVDVTCREIRLGSGKTVRYDWLSLNVGSEVDISGLDVDKRGLTIWSAKPIPPLFDLRKTLEAAMHKTGEMPGTVVIGGGATGSELAANLAGLARRHGVRPRLTLVSSSDCLLASAPLGASRAMRRALEKYPVQIRCQQRVKAITRDGVALENDEVIACEHVLVAIGLQAKSLVRELGLEASHAGLRVDPLMRSINDHRVFAAGDCASFTERSLPKLGVFGVKAAHIIHHNILAGMKGRPLKSYKPQKVWLAILNLGDGTGLMVWWRLWWLGKASERLKDWIDRRFMAQYRHV